MFLLEAIVVRAPLFAFEIDVLVGDMFKAAEGTNTRSRLVIVAIGLLFLDAHGRQARVLAGGPPAG
jgi:hypothetical protein